ncbi:MAG: hypothetical protein SF187_27825 [Deltaproteobacteria bacterium]|nr:hypothetical protein [Deltaproteobacteria bacterium]
MSVAKAQAPTANLDEPAGDMRVVIDPCVGVEVDVVTRIVTLEQALVFADAQAPTRPQALIATVNCASNGLRLKVQAPHTGAHVERQLAHDAYPLAARPRLLALSLVEMAAVVSGARAQIVDVPTASAPAGVMAIAPRPHTEAQAWRAQLSWGQEWGRVDSTSRGATGLSLSRHVLRIVNARLQAEAAHLSFATDYGQVRVDRFVIGASVGPLIEVKAVLFSAGLGLRAGYLRLQGRPEEANVNGFTTTRFTWGPAAFVQVGYSFTRSFSAAFGLEGGAHARPIEARIDGLKLGRVTGLWVQPFLALGYTL